MIAIKRRSLDVGGAHSFYLSNDGTITLIFSLPKALLLVQFDAGL